MFIFKWQRLKKNDPEIENTGQDNFDVEGLEIEKLDEELTGETEAQVEFIIAPEHEFDESVQQHVDEHLYDWQNISIPGPSSGSGTDFNSLLTVSLFF